MLDTFQFLRSLATRWSAKFPTHQKRITKGLRLANGGKVAPRGLDSFRVVGSTGEYLVEINCGFPKCSCPYHQRCSHIWACALMVRLAQELAPAQPIEQPLRPARRLPRKPTANELSNHCRALHDANRANIEQFSMAPVIPLYRHQK